MVKNSRRSIIFIVYSFVVVVVVYQRKQHFQFYEMDVFGGHKSISPSSSSSSSRLPSVSIVVIHYSKLFSPVAANV